MTCYQLGDLVPEIHDSVFIAAEATVIGQAVLREGASIWPGAVIRADNEPIVVGEGSNVQEGAVLHTDLGCPLTIGKGVTIGHQAMLHGCTIGNRVLIGMKSMIMDGAIVEDEVIVAAGAVVTPGKVLESGYLYVGNPAKQARHITEKERSFFTYGAGNYVRLKDMHLAEGYDKPL